MDLPLDLKNAPKNIRFTGSGIIGNFSSFKMGGKAIFYRSTIERDLMYFMEFDEDVIAYYSQYKTIENTVYKGELHKYTPDIWAHCRTTNRIYECKPESKLQDDDVHRQITIGSSWALSHHFLHYVVTDKQIRQGFRLKNLKLLYKYCRLPVNYQVFMECKALFGKDTSKLPFLELSYALAGKGRNLSMAPTIYYLLFHHFLVADLDFPLTAETIISLAEGGMRNV